MKTLYLLVGPPGSGKTHIALAWALEVGARQLAAGAGPGEGLTESRAGPVSAAYCCSGMGAPFTAQETPNRSVSMPKVSAQNDGASGIGRTITAVRAGGEQRK